ncbi:hypothetical protein [Psychromicrobium lacuslunae]|uniref:Polysaccharide biosynthesis protein n=1 Tax=Psychromicrobium lacuslunae TaxID=1618207 RepID=A0A0D4BY75_9MICC|nr:hypothetical protein [Psychromicrobium lacuslunae]AJT41417.1 hypothetical protein UM93_07625 [Psychromicrobium lacuslunae]
MTEVSASPAQQTDSRLALLYLLGSLLQGLALILIQPFAIRAVDGVQWGLISSSVATIQIVIVLLSAGLPLAITQRWFNPANGRDRALGMYGFLALACLLIGVLLAIVVLIISGLGSGISWELVWAMISLGLLGTILGAQAILRAQGRPLLFVLLSIVSSVLANLAGLLALLVIGPSAANYLGGYLIVVLASAVLAVLLVKPKLPWKVTGVLKETSAVALPLLPHTGALMLLTQGAVLLLISTAGEVSAGRYGAVLIFVLGPLTVLNALNNAWSTRMMSAVGEGSSTRLRQVATEAALAGLLVGAVASAAAVLGATVLSRDPELLTPVATILPLASVGYALFLVATNVTYITERTSMMAYLTPAVLLVVLLFALPQVLANNLGALALVHAGGFSLLGLVYWWLNRRTKVGKLPLKAFIWCFAVHLLLVVMLSLIPVTLTAGLLEAAVVWLLALGFAAFALRRAKRSVA